MTKKISTYKEMLEEKERLQKLLNEQKQVLKADVQGIKEEFEPVRAAVGVLKKFAKKDSSNPLLTMASGRIISLVLNKLVLGRAGWFARLAVPFLAKNISSHVIAENKTAILGKIATVINRIRGHKVPKTAAVPRPGASRPGTTRPEAIRPGTTRTEMVSPGIVRPDMPGTDTVLPGTVRPAEF